MGRKKGPPAYKNKVIGPKTIITTRDAWRKVKNGERVSNKSVSDIFTHYVEIGPEITKDTFKKVTAETT